MNIYDVIRCNRVIPVVKINDRNKTTNLLNAISNGGINICEITLRTPEAMFSIERIANSCLDITVGAGTVLNVEQAESAIKAGAKFIVSPGISEDVCKYCIDRNVPIIPGCVTATELMKAYNLGILLVKFFPCEAFGGLKTIKALSGPFPMIDFIPTGGITYDNIDTYLSYPKVWACGASYLAPEQLIFNDDFDEITRLCKITKEKVDKISKI